ncbi:MAG: SPOR domain-containing protein [Candidatus Omnitrophica bacterium]|nr:SPOR domain-containing protein [Candidatus Omnitrophota bacterium]
MERNNAYQLELFTPGANAGVLKPRSEKKAFLARFRAYDKVILMIIGIVVTSIVSFSLGVEKGKQISMRKSSAVFDVALVEKLPQAPLIKQQPAVKTQAPAVQAAVKLATVAATGNKNVVVMPSVQTAIGSYAIQVASYKTKSAALRESEALKKQGFVTTLLTKGDYIVLCVGNFNSKEKAQTMLPQLAKRYQGCMIRRL